MVEEAEENGDCALPTLCAPFIEALDDELDEELLDDELDEELDECVGWVAPGGWLFTKALEGDPAGGGGKNSEGLKRDKAAAAAYCCCW